MISRGQMYRQMYYGGGQGVMSLDAGAPSIKYTGDIRPQMTSAPDPMADMYNQFLNMKKQGIIPQDMDFDSFKDLLREQAAYGGQMRQQYGLGSIVKKAVKGVTNVVKDVVKSDVGKAALGIAGLYYAPALLSGGALSPGLAGYQSGLGFAGNVLKSKLADIGLTSLVPKTALGRAGAIAAIGGLTGFLSSQGKSEEEIEAIKRDPNALKTYLRQYYTNLNPELINKPEMVEKFVQSQIGEYAYAVGGRVGLANGLSPELMERIKNMTEKLDSLPEQEEPEMSIEDFIKKEKIRKMLEEKFTEGRFSEVMKKAYGGRIYKALGDTAQMAAGIEGLPLRTNQAGVNEVDLRETGGFIPPVGVKEKADDIPAMLSNNEFVFTADAVRGMGNGDVDRGAEKLYNMMKTLEKGGRV